MVHTRIKSNYYVGRHKIEINKGLGDYLGESKISLVLFLEEREYFQKRKCSWSNALVFRTWNSTMEQFSPSSYGRRNHEI